MPFDFDRATSSYIVVTASIDGKRPMRFALDTGCPYPCVISPRTAKELGLKIKSTEVKVADLPGDLAEISTIALLNPGTGKSVTVNGLDEAFVTNLSPVEKSTEGAIDGILGLSLIRQLILRVDYRKRTLEFFHSEEKIDVPGATRMEMPFRPLLGKFELSVDIGRSRFPMLLDTGASESRLPANAVFALRPKAAMVTEGWSLYGTEFRSTVRGEAVNFAGVKLQRFDPVVQLPSVKSDRRESLLGNDILSRFRCTFDFPHGEAFFEPSGDVPQRHGSEDARVREAQGRFVVASVEPGTPAGIAGLRPGQEIVSIDGRDPIPGLTDRQLNGLEGTRATVKVREGDQERTLIWTRPDQFSWAKPKPTTRMGIHGLGGGPKVSLLVMRMRSGTPAWNLGLRPGHQIRTINGKPVMDPAVFPRIKEFFTYGGVPITIEDFGGRPRQIQLPNLRPTVKTTPKTGRRKPVSGRQSGG